MRRFRRPLACSTEGRLVFRELDEGGGEAADVVPGCGEAGCEVLFPQGRGMAWVCDCWRLGDSESRAVMRARAFRNGALNGLV